MGIERFQKDVATGRFTLPAVIFVCLLLWGMTARSWNELGSLGVTVLIGYLMIEANTTLTLTQVRTALPVCICWFLYAGFPFLHPFQWDNLVPLAFLIAVFQLFRSYESSSAATSAYNAFLALGAGSLAFPQIIWLVPLFLASMVPFRSMGTKSFLASVLGLATPYWFLLCHAFLTGQMALCMEPIRETMHIYPINYRSLPMETIVSWAVVVSLQLVFGACYLHGSYQDKTRTRIYHSFLVYAGWWISLSGLLQPVHLPVLLPMQVICTAFLGGHLFTLTRNRFSGILFVVTFASFILLSVYNLWMHFFNS